MFVSRKRQIFFAFLFFTLGIISTYSTAPLYAAGLVSCGNNIEIGSTDTYLRYQGECTFCDLLVLGMSVFNFLIVIMIALSALIFAQAGFLYVTSPANPGNISRAHKLFANTLIGVVLTLAAYLFIDTIMRTLVAGSLGEEAVIDGIGPWNEILCHEVNDYYFIPKITPIDLNASVLKLPKLDCATVGGTCVANASDCGGNTPHNDTTCPADKPVCCTAANQGQVCTAQSGSITYPGHCYPGSCPSGQSGAAASECTSGSTCCYQAVHGNMAIVAYAESMKAKGCLYNQALRNNCAGDPGYTDCSDLVSHAFEHAGCGSPGASTDIMYNTAKTQPIGDGSSLVPGDAIVYRYPGPCPGGTCGHVVICMTNACTQVIHARGTGKGIQISNGGPHLSKSGAKSIRASDYCP